MIFLKHKWQECVNGQLILDYSYASTPIYGICIDKGSMRHISIFNYVLTCDTIDGILHYVFWIMYYVPFCGG